MTATRYQAASKRGKGVIPDELCANTGWHRSHARKALKAALAPTVVTMRSARPVKYGPEVIAALTICWTVLGKRLASMLTELVAVCAWAQAEFADPKSDPDTYLGPMG
nr:hypothetical protein [Mycobacterium gordonae]